MVALLLACSCSIVNIWVGCAWLSVSALFGAGRFNGVLLKLRRDALHDLLGLVLVVHGVCVEVLGGSQLQLGHLVLSRPLNGDLLGLGQISLLPAHDLDKLLKFLDFLRLSPQNITIQVRILSTIDLDTSQKWLGIIYLELMSLTIFPEPCSFNK